MRRPARRWSLAAALLLAGCGTDSGPGEVLNVYAASSLTEAFRDIERAFEAANPDVDVQLTLAGSQVLRLQIEQGAAADVFASANQDHMQALVRGGRVRRARVLARNELAVIVPLTNPARIESFTDLPRARRLVIGTPNVPVGRYTREALSRAALRYGSDFEATVLQSVVSEESNVRLVRAKVELGEADAAIVYRTDAVASERVRLIPVPVGVNARADYLIAVVAGSGRLGLANRWLSFVTSSEGRTVLGQYGFGVG